MIIRPSRKATLGALRDASNKLLNKGISWCHAVSVIFNEPLTFLQRVAEYMEYVYLLHTAASLDDQLQRMQVN